MKRTGIEVFIFSIVIALFVAPNLAVASDLSTWGSYFSHDYNKVNAYHFALIRSVNTGQAFHTAGSEVIYAFDPQDPWIQTYVNGAAITTAQSIWGGWVKFTRNSVAGSHVVIRYGGTNTLEPRWLAAVYHPSYPSDTNTDGTAKKGGYIGMDFYAYGVQNRSSSHIGHTLAHEFGHVVGLNDVYNLDVANTTDSIMGDGMQTLNSLGRPDINGLMVLQHNPWFWETNGTWKYWNTPGTFKTGWQWLKDGNGLNYWFFFLSNGTMSTNNWHPDSVSYGYCGADGRAYVNGWYKIAGYWYYFNATGSRYQNTWQPDSVSWAYLDGNGRALTGWQWLKDGNGAYYWFYFDTSSASMYVNRLQADSGGTCYLKSNGRAAQSEWVTINGTPRYFDSAYHLTTRTR